MQYSTFDKMTTKYDDKIQIFSIDIYAQYITIS